MNTTIDIDKLVDAFRAKAQEKIDAAKAERKARDEATAAQGQRCLAALQEVWPAFVQVIGHLHMSRITVEPQTTPNSGTALAAFRLIYASTSSTYEVDRVIIVEESGGAISYCMLFGKEGGRLLDDDSELPVHRRVENPADLIVTIAKFAGNDKVRREQAR